MHACVCVCVMRSYVVSKFRSVSRCAVCLRARPFCVHVLPNVFIRISGATCICAFTQHLERVLSQQCDRVTGAGKVGQSCSLQA